MSTLLNVFKDQLNIGLYGFATYLRQSAQVIDPEKEKMFESMEKPLTDYWIASSHNTYLEDDQLKGKNSPEVDRKRVQFDSKLISRTVIGGSVQESTSKRLPMC